MDEIAGGTGDEILYILSRDVWEHIEQSSLGSIHVHSAGDS